jgi:hypothetical protein
MKTVKQMLTAARDALVTVGWVQGHYSNSQGYCLVGAIRHGSGYPDDVAWYRDQDVQNAYRDALVFVARAIDPRNSTEGDIIVWNDNLDRTSDEVVGLLNRVIEQNTEPVYVSV